MVLARTLIKVNRDVKVLRAYQWAPEYTGNRAVKGIWMCSGVQKVHGC